MTITDEQRAKFVYALKHSGFSEFDQDIYVKPHGKRKIGVNLTTGIDIYFVEGTKRIDEDDDTQTLEHVAKLLTDALNDDIDTDTQPLVLESPDINNFPVTKTIDTYGIVRPAVSAMQAIESWNEFQALKKAVITQSDLQRIGDKDYMKKSAWRKFATFFNLTDRITEETQTQHAENNGWTWKIKVECIAPNGRITEGVGMCSTSERQFAHVEHDTYTTAHTRAKNRAISDMVAAGEVSAEEVSV